MVEVVEVLRKIRSFILAPFGLLFGLLVRLRYKLYEIGLLKSHKIPLPTISIGNISVGGTGKTPILFELLKELEAQGHSAAVLSRGNGGDEGVLLKRKYSEVLLLENPDRVSASKNIPYSETDIVILDDGFQHFRLQRDADIVVLDATAPFGPLIPAGWFRENPNALLRADLIIITRADLVSRERLEKIHGVIEKSRKGAPQLPVVETRMCAVGLRNIATGMLLPLDDLRGQEVVLAAGIGNHESFLKLCESFGVKIQKYWKFPDHYEWSNYDLNRFSDIKYVLVTEKDGVKLSSISDDRFYEVVIEVQFLEGEEAFLNLISNLCLNARASKIEPLWSGIENVD
jgi:tetraacyldisaccharide 4'-kinase